MKNTTAILVEKEKKRENLYREERVNKPITISLQNLSWKYWYNFVNWVGETDTSKIIPIRSNHLLNISTNIL